MSARVVFLGTPTAAVPTLEALSSEHEVALVVTQPDRPRGRSKQPLPPPVKDWATSHEIEVAQPTSGRELLEVLQAHGPVDVGVVVAYGRIIRPQVLELPARGLINVHFSLLPRWRGAAPVARALMAGDEMTGVTIMKLDEGLDTGPVITAQGIDIPARDDAGALTKRLADMGARLLIGVLPQYLSGEVEPVPQSDEGATYADKIESVDRPIDVTQPAMTIVDQVRGLAPSPAATLDLDGKTHKILAAEVVDAAVDQGTWVVLDGRPVVGAGDGAVALLSLQPPGKTPQSGVDWANGRQRGEGSVG